MPGLYGVVSFDESPEEELFAKLSSKISGANESDYHYIDENALIGLKSLGTLDFKDQPFLEERKGLSLLFWGEIFSHSSRISLIADFIFDLYLTKRLERLSDLNGFFSFALWDFQKSRLVLASDIYATRPIYYHRDNNIMVFGSSPFAVAGALNLRKINREVLAQFLSIQLIQGNSTWIDSIEKLRYGHYLIFDREGLRINRYFKPVFRPIQMGRSEVAGTLIEGLGVSAVRMSRGKTALSLSGGGDSRLIALVCRQSGIDVPTFTFGGVESSDIAIAQKFCKAFDVEHYPLLIAPDFLKSSIRDATYNTGGYSSAINYHGFSTRHDVKSFADICLSGLSGNFFVGYPSLTLHRFAGIKDEQKFRAELKRWLNNGFRQHKLNLLLKTDCTDLIDQTVERLLSEYMQETYLETLLAIHYFEIANQVLSAGFWLENDVLEFRDVYRDYSLMELNLQIPAKYKISMGLGREIWRRHFPEAGRIIYQRTGLPISASMPMVVLKKIKDRVLRITQPPGIMDYSKIFRTILKDWIREFLISDESRSLEYLNRDIVSKLIDDHAMKRRDNASKIGILLTFEQVLRIVES